MYERVTDEQGNTIGWTYPDPSTGEPVFLAAVPDTTMVADAAALDPLMPGAVAPPATETATPEEVADPFVGNQVAARPQSSTGGWSDSGNPYVAPSYEPPPDFGDGYGAPVDLSGDYPRYTGSTPAPSYANGATHPFFGGIRPTYPDDGDSGPAPLPFQPGQRYGASNNAAGGGGSFGGGSSGGGGGGNDLYWSLRNKLVGKMMGGSSYSSSSYEPYEYPEPELPYDEKTSGFAKRYDAGTLNSLIYSNPQFVIEDATGYEAGSPGFQDLAALPMTNLAILSKGGSKGWRGAPYATGKTALDDDPYNDRQYSPGQMANTLGSLYKKVGETGGWFNEQKLGNNLFDPARGSAIDTAMRGDPGSALYTFESYLGSLAGTTLSPAMAEATMGYANTLIDGWGNKAIRSKNPPQINRFVGRRLGW